MSSLGLKLVLKQILFNIWTTFNHGIVLNLNNGLITHKNKDWIWKYNL